MVGLIGSGNMARVLAHKLARLAAVASPGGTTARGLAALERGGVALSQAIDDGVQVA